MVQNHVLALRSFYDGALKACFLGQSDTIACLIKDFYEYSDHHLPKFAV